MSVWDWVCIVMAAAYAGLILVYLIGWIWIREEKGTISKPALNAFSILLAARNEEHAISHCLESLRKQKYPLHLFEILVLNDHSDDQTGERVRECIARYPEVTIKLFAAEELGFFGKKDAISKGVVQANFPYIVLTDADCTRGEFWLQSIDAFIQKHPARMIYAPVFFNYSNLFEAFQALEFSGLVGIGGAAIQLKNPNMCSAANLIFSKEAFLAVGGYEDNQHLASGDDEFLLHKIFKKYPDGVYFLKDKKAIVHTSPNVSLDQLSQQRRRWVSKSTQYEERWITAILVAAYFFNLSILVNFVYGIWESGFLMTACIQLSLKMLAEGIFLLAVLRFFEKSKLFLLIPPVQPFHILYVVIIGIWANVKTYTWKERELK